MKSIHKSLLAFSTIASIFISCHKEQIPECKQVPTRMDSLVGTWVKYKTQEYRQDTFYSSYTHPLSTQYSLELYDTASIVPNCIESHTYGFPSIATRYSLPDPNTLVIDTIGTPLIIGTYLIERLEEDTMVLYQKYSFETSQFNYRIKFVFVKN